MSIANLQTVQIGDRADFISKVYTCLGFSLLTTCVAAYYGMSMPLTLFWPLSIFWFILMLATMFLQRAFPLNLILLFMFSVVGGLVLGPTLNMYVARGMGHIIPVATGATAVTFGGLSVYVNLTKQDFSFMGGFLTMGLLGMLLIGLLSLFFPIPINGVIYGGVGILLFSGFILYDTSNLSRRYNDDQYVAATIALYLDMLNLFRMILLVLGGGNRR